MPQTSGRLIVAASEHNADLLYATKLFVPDPFVWCEANGEQHVIVSPLELGRVKRQLGATTRVWGTDEAKATLCTSGRSLAGQVAGLSRYLGVEHWQVPASFPLHLAQELALHGVTCRAVSDSFFPEREVKQPEEVEHLTEGVRLAEAGLDRALTILREAEIVDAELHWQAEVLSAEFLRGEIDATISRLGGQASHTIVAPGREGADPHNQGFGTIRPHEPIIIDIFPRVSSTGYFGDLTRTVVKGQASETVKRAYEAVRQARDEAKARIAAGVNGQDVHQHVVAVLEQAGFETDLEADPPHGFFHGTGHGLGLEVHEAPRISRTDCALQEGHVVTVEPGVYYPAWGGVRLEDVVVVEANGCRCLTAVETSLEIE